MKLQLDKVLWNAISKINKDVAYGYGGWVWFSCRLIGNCIMLFFILQFIEGFFNYVWDTYGITEDQSESLNIILFAISAIYLVLKIPTWKEVNE